MTENEVIEKLKIFPEWNKVDEWLSVAAMQELVDTCIEAFKENQRYRELGRIEFLSDMKSHYVEALSNLRQYQKIGTVEECREARENRWISCSERLPEEPEKIPEDDEELEQMYLNDQIKEYIVTIEDSSKATTLHYVGENVWIDITTMECYEVIAWQQLPEQYEGDEKNMKKSIKAYIIPHEAWYKNSVAGNPYICVGFYREGGGTEGEFEITWDKVGIRLRAYSDSWEVLRKMPELIELMAKISREKLKPTINEFSEMLNNIGFKDITEREGGVNG